MGTKIQMAVQEEVDDSFLTQVRSWLSLLARSIMNLEVDTFQERLEKAARQLITKTSL